ncbi:MAG: glycosyl transferase [Methylophilales bacterium]|nr:glycosyl transferase [Methylophilales bacterium]
MSPGLDHDWQAVFANPKPKIGERTKTRLLILLCVLWVIIGLAGHAPWKPDELISVSIIKHLLAGGDWVVPMLAGEPWLKNPPLYYLVAALFAKLPLLSLHDAARLSSGMWMSLTLLFIGMAGRELWGVGSGRQTALIFIGSIGLVFTAHSISPEVSGLTGYAMAFYALALSPRRPLRAGLLLGTGAGIGFLSKGLLNLEIITSSALLLPLLFDHWRRSSYWLVLSVGVVAALPWIAPWLVQLQQHAPDLFDSWLENSRVISRNFVYFSRAILWYAWPALPLAIWTLSKWRPDHAPIQLCLLFFLISFAMLGISTTSRDVYLLPLLIPLTLLATPAVETLSRSLAAALNWFGIMLFAVVGGFIWVGWFAMMTGFPVKLAGRMHKLSLGYVPEFNVVFFIAALMFTIVWIVVVFNSNRSNRAAINDWAVGMLLFWGLVMTLWLPWLDAAKSYQAPFLSMQKALPANYACITARDVGESQRAALDYYANIHVQRFEIVQSLSCDLYLIEDELGRAQVDPGDDWKLVWQGKRPSDRRESFRLYQHL